MQPDYRARRVIVSGCTSGIGAATARLLMAQSAEVHGLDARPAVDQFASFSQVNLRDHVAVEAAVSRIGAPVHALFNCAGLAPGCPPADVVAVNFLGTRHLTECVLRQMSSGASIVNVASNAGSGWRQRLNELAALTAMPSLDQLAIRLTALLPSVSNAYAFSKELLLIWSMQQSLSLIHRGIRINCTSPGVVQTPMLADIERRVPLAAITAVEQPIGRRSSAEEQAWPLLWLNSEHCSYINGADLPIDGGYATQVLLAQHTLAAQP
jgi:NAD(P)-dependent dehydrogenase (short-subunit alcohol dehydrogenase family)